MYARGNKTIFISIVFVLLSLSIFFCHKIIEKKYELNRNIKELEIIVKQNEQQNNEVIRGIEL